MYFVMTVDIDPPFSSAYDFAIKEGTISLLNLFAKYEIKATFFVPGVVAKNFPTIIKNIVDQKHEIACHGLKHEPHETSLSYDKQVQIIGNSTKIIAKIAGVKPIGFRAPFFRINKECLMALHKLGYIYDSSLVSSPLYTSFKNSRPRPYKIAFSKISGNASLVEIPVSANIFLPFPLGGGWLRIFGLNWAKIGIKATSVLGAPVVFYIHPKDVYPPPIGYRLYWYNYRNTTNCIKILDKIIQYVREKGAVFLTGHELALLMVKQNLIMYNATKLDLSSRLPLSKYMLHV